MSEYWIPRYRFELIKWLSSRYPLDSHKFKRMKFKQLMAIYHSVRRRFDMSGETLGNNLGEVIAKSQLEGLALNTLNNAQTAYQLAYNEGYKQGRIDANLERLQKEFDKPNKEN